MSRLQKKCLLASSSLHGLLLLIVVVGSAFFVSEPKPEKLHFIKFANNIPTDGESSGGGNPDRPPTNDRQKGETLVAPPQPPTRQPTPPVPQPPVQPTQTKPPSPRVEPRHAEVPLPKPPVIKPNRDTLLKDLPRPQVSPTKPTFDPKTELTSIKQTAQEIAANQAKAREAADARERAAAGQRIARQIAKTKEGLQAGFAPGAAVDIDGPGGEAFANYADLVKTVYEDAWRVPDSLIDDDSTAKVTVTIGRNGYVISARIQRRSGNSELDRSVQRALDSVKFIARFPSGAKDESRTFTINFNLKAKRLAG